MRDVRDLLRDAGRSVRRHRGHADLDRFRGLVQLVRGERRELGVDPVAREVVVDLGGHHGAEHGRRRRDLVDRVEALRRAVPDSWDTIGEAIEETVPVELHMRTYQLIESTPALLAVHLRRSMELDEEIARVIADRLGLDVDYRSTAARGGRSVQWGDAGDRSPVG